MSSSELVPNRLDARYVRDFTPIYPGRYLPLDWVKADSVGTVSRFWEFDRTGLSYDRTVVNILRNEGYYQLNDGTNVVLLEDLMSDRATGEIRKIITPIPLDSTRVDFNDYTDNGLVSFDGSTPVAAADSYRVTPGGSATFDVLANDSEPDGGRMWISGVIHPLHGEAFVTGDNKIRYVPDIGFSGTDSMSYWLRDEEGHIAQGEVSIRVGSGDIPRPRVINRPAADVLDVDTGENYRPIAAQDRVVFGRGETRIVHDVTSNDYDDNDDDITLTSVIRADGIDGIDMRMNANGVSVITAKPGAEGGAWYFYTATDGELHDFGIFPVFIGRNNATNPASEPRFNPSVRDIPKMQVEELNPFDVDIYTTRDKVKQQPLTYGKAYRQQEIGANNATFVVSSKWWDIGSVKFYLNGVEIHTDNSAPFTAFGERGSTFLGRNLSVGEHELRVVATEHDNSRGHLLFEVRTRFEVTADGSAQSISSSTTNSSGSNNQSASSNTAGSNTAATNTSGSNTSSGNASSGNASSGNSASNGLPDNVNTLLALFAQAIRNPSSSVLFSRRSVDSPPTVSFTTVFDGETVPSTVPFRGINVFANDPDAGAEDGAGIRWVQFVLSEAETGKMLLSDRDFDALYEWGLSLRPGVSYVLTAYAVSTEEAGGGWASATVTVTAEQ